MSKKYIFFIGTLCDGGAERVVSILSGKMAEQGMDVEILTYYDRPVFYKIDSRVKISSVEKFTEKKSLFYNLMWIRHYFQEHAQFVISFLAPFNIVSIVANLGTGIPMIVADRNDPAKVPTNLLTRKLRNFLYRFADGVVLQTEKNKEYFCNTVQKKGVVIYNPIELGKNQGIALRTQKEKIFVSAGRLMPQKNQKMLIDAFGEILKTHPDYRLVIYGEGPERNHLESLVREKEIQDSVFLPGSISNLHEQMKCAKLFVLTSDYEGMPNALIEAMCLGLPVISTKVSGATDLILDHENGILVEVGNQEKLQDAMLELIENPELAAHLANKAVELNETLELSKIMNQWIDFIKKITAEKY